MKRKRSFLAREPFIFSVNALRATNTRLVRVGCVMGFQPAAMLARLKRDVPSSSKGRRGDREEDGDDVVLEGRKSESSLPLHKRLFFLAKIDKEGLAEKVSNVKFPAAIQDRKLPGLPELRKAYDEFTHPEFKPDRRRLSSVEDFFRYTEEEGRRFFDDIDGDGDGRLKLEDLKVAMRKRNLPPWYAKAFMEKAKPNFFSRTIGWEDFKSVMDERESTMLRAFNSLGVGRSGTMKDADVKQSLKRLGLPATDENAAAMLRHLAMGEEGYVSYGQFRNFLMLLPRDVTTSTDPSVLWFEASTMVQLRPPKGDRSATVKLAIQAALAGALASGSSTAVMHPMDTLKTRIQATVGAGPSMKAFLKSIPEIGARRLYRGIIPAVVGAASGHGFRTATYEVACKLLAPLAMMPLITEIQIQGFGSGLGTLVGTSVRIPCEVLKQRLQTGQHDNVFEAFGAVTKGGYRGLFAGTAATLSREIPFYVIGLVAYEKLKKAAAAAKRKDLNAWETICLGGISGAIAAAATTPADVLKTRAMTGQSPVGEAIWVTVRNVVSKEGPGALMKGCVPRMVWIAPLGAMNFAGYELAKRAMQAADELEANLQQGEESSSSSSSSESSKATPSTLRTTTPPPPPQSGGGGGGGSGDAAAAPTASPSPSTAAAAQVEEGEAGVAGDDVGGNSSAESLVEVESSLDTNAGTPKDETIPAFRRLPAKLPAKPPPPGPPPFER